MRRAGAAVRRRALQRVLKASGVLDRKSKRLWLPVSAYLIAVRARERSVRPRLAPRYEPARRLRAQGADPLARLAAAVFYEIRLLSKAVRPSTSSSRRGASRLSIGTRCCSFGISTATDANGLKLVAADAKKILVSKDEPRFAENGSPVNRIRYNADWSARHEDADLRLEWPYGLRRPVLRRVRRRDARDGSTFRAIPRACARSGSRGRTGGCADGAATRKNRGSKMPLSGIADDRAAAAEAARVDQGTEVGAELRCVHRLRPRFRCQTGRDYIIKGANVGSASGAACSLFSGLNNFYRGCLGIC